MSAIVVPPAFPLVGLGVLSTFILNLWQQTLASMARKETGIKYPTLYVTDAEAQADPKKMRYNCTQRAHANTLESSPYILAFLGYLGIFHPKAATAFTITWVLGRIPYTLNYATGKPETRGYGLAKVSYIGILGLLLGSIGVSVQRSYQLLF